MTEWVRVEDRLPYSYQYVLVCQIGSPGGYPSPVSIARKPDEENEWEFLSCNDDGSGVGAFADIEWPLEVFEITHWMPLPHPPEL